MVIGFALLFSHFFIPQIYIEDEEHDSDSHELVNDVLVRFVRIWILDGFWVCEFCGISGLEFLFEFDLVVLDRSSWQVPPPIVSVVVGESDRLGHSVQHHFVICFCFDVGL